MQTKAEVSASRKAYDAAYHHAHKEGRNAYAAAYKATHREEIAASNAAYYGDHKEERSARDAAYRDGHKDERRQDQVRFKEWLQIFRAVNGCEDCEAHAGKLEHHHIDPSIKTRNVSEMYHHSLDAIEDELEKCVVLCRSCHMKRHVELILSESAAVC